MVNFRNRWRRPVFLRPCVRCGIRLRRERLCTSAIRYLRHCLRFRLPHYRLLNVPAAVAFTLAFAVAVNITLAVAACEVRRSGYDDALDSRRQR